MGVFHQRLCGDKKKMPGNCILVMKTSKCSLHKLLSLLCTVFNKMLQIQGVKDTAPPALIK